MSEYASWKKDEKNTGTHSSRSCLSILPSVTSREPDQRRLAMKPPSIMSENGSRRRAIPPPPKQQRGGRQAFGGPARGAGIGPNKACGQGSKRG